MNERTDFGNIAESLEKLSTAINELNRAGVIRSRKFVSDFAEWLVAKMYDGSIAPSKTQKHWDVKVGTEKIQIKSHSKAMDNPNRWSQVKSIDKFDTLIILVLTENFKLQEFYRIPSEQLKPYLKPHDSDYKVNWDDIKDWKISKKDIPEFSSFSIFFV